MKSAFNERLGFEYELSFQVDDLFLEFCILSVHIFQMLLEFSDILLKLMCSEAITLTSYRSKDSESGRIVWLPSIVVFIFMTELLNNMLCFLIYPDVFLHLGSHYLLGSIEIIDMKSSQGELIINNFGIKKKLTGF